MHVQFIGDCSDHESRFCRAQVPQSIGYNSNMLRGQFIVVNLPFHEALLRSIGGRRNGPPVIYSQRFPLRSPDESVFITVILYSNITFRYLVL